MKPSSMAYLCWSLAAAFWLAAAIADAAGIRINHTSSLPMGIWRIAPLEGQPERSQIVSFCPPDTDILRRARARGYLASGQCPGGYQPMLKPVAAIPRDTVIVTAHGITVNGALVEGSNRLALDSDGSRLPALPEGAYRVGAEQVWLLSSHPRSFDSRYFGPVSMEAIIGKARPWQS
jgi:conjugative transfer signal peptidase TraF